MILAGCEFINAILTYIGTMYLTASAVQMLRGGQVLWTVLLSVWFLKRKYQLYNYLGLALCSIGLLFVSYSSLLDSSSIYEVNSRHALLGLICVFVAV